jgi:hypothetical protein
MTRDYAIFQHLPDDKIYFAEILNEKDDPYVNTHLSINVQMIFDMSFDDCVDCLRSMYRENLHIFSNYIQVNSTNEIRTALLEHAQIPKVSGRYINRSDIGEYVAMGTDFWK